MMLTITRDLFLPTPRPSLLVALMKSKIRRLLSTRTATAHTHPILAIYLETASILTPFKPHYLHSWEMPALFPPASTESNLQIKIEATRIHMPPTLLISTLTLRGFIRAATTK
jgi:hypothetical protein